MKQTMGPTYTFEKSWGRAGGNLFGANFISDISSDIAPNSRVNIDCIDDVYIISSIESDPDYLLYLWKKGRGERFDFLITSPEILFLYEFYRVNGFDYMLNDVIAASSRLEKNNLYCIIS